MSISYFSFCVGVTTFLGCQDPPPLPDEQIVKMLSVDEFKEERVQIVKQGAAILPSLKAILQSPERYEQLVVVRVLVVLRELGDTAKPLRPLVRRQLLADSSSLRFRAIEALVSLGSSKDVPAIVAMLHDPYGPVRYQAVVALGKLGDDEVALLALEIWHKRVAKADKTRKNQWLYGMHKEIEKAKIAISQRINKKKGADKGK